MTINDSFIQIDHLDHLVLTVSDLERTCRFYADLLGMEVINFGEGRTALRFGRQKINLHQVGREFEPRARQAVPGSADLCFLTDTPVEEAMRQLQACGVMIIGGPVDRTGAQRMLRSIYLRDPDGNLIEIANETKL